MCVCVSVALHTSLETQGCTFVLVFSKRRCVDATSVTALRVSLDGSEGEMSTLSSLVTMEMCLTVSPLVLFHNICMFYDHVGDGC